VGAVRYREDVLRYLGNPRCGEHEKGQEGEGNAASRRRDGMLLIVLNVRLLA
jgi:hypothetical protein